MCRPCRRSLIRRLSLLRRVLGGPAGVGVRGTDAPVARGHGAALGGDGLVLPSAAGSFTLSTGRRFFHAATQGGSAVTLVHGADPATGPGQPASACVGTFQREHRLTRTVLGTSRALPPNLNTTEPMGTRATITWRRATDDQDDGESAPVIGGLQVQIEWSRIRSREQH